MESTTAPKPVPTQTNAAKTDAPKAVDDELTLDEVGTSAIRQANGKRMYELFFRIGTRRPEHKIFEIAGDMPEAVAEARRHCEVMGYRFCGCHPFLVDLRKQEISRNDEIRRNSIMD